MISAITYRIAIDRVDQLAPLVDSRLKKLFQSWSIVRQECKELHPAFQRDTMVIVF